MGENAETIRRGIDFFNHGKVAELMDLYSEDVEVESPGSVIGGSYKGKQGLGEWFQKVGSTFSGGIRLDVENLVEHGDQVLVEWSSKGTLSNGKPYAGKSVSVFTFRGPKVARQRLYEDTEQLARDLGRI